MLSKGIVSAILDEGKKVTVKPYGAGLVSAPLNVPTSLVGLLTINMPVIYISFEDNTGIVLSRVDGLLNTGGDISAHSDGDAIIIETGKGGQ